MIDAEVIFWVVSCIVGWGGFGLLQLLAKRDSVNYVSAEGWK